MGSRGAFIVLEGCDKAGKSTQVKLLVESLNKKGISAEARSFPNRTTEIGKFLHRFLSKEIDFPSETAHLLFSANRWECQQDILKALHAGTTLIVDRYAASGAAYTAANTNKSLSWCQEPDRGLPCPDLVALFQISEETQNTRGNENEERFENIKIQRKVASNFNKLKDNSWEIVNANQDISTIHNKLLKKVLNIIEKVKDSPIRLLYES